MARKGGYRRGEPVEYIEASREHYAEAITTARAMGQTLETWLGDAIRFHVYACERYHLAQVYREDCERAAQRGSLQPLATDSQYQPRRPKPTLTLGVEQGSTPSQRRPRYQG